MKVVDEPWKHADHVIESNVLGQIAIMDDQVVEFAAPIAGFPQCRRYALLPYQQAGREDRAMRWLQALDSPFHTFLVTDPWNAEPDYEPEIEEADADGIGVASFDDAVLYTILTVSRSTNELLVNLRAPLMINPGSRVGRQLLLRNADAYSTRHKVCDLP